MSDNEYSFKEYMLIQSKEMRLYRRILEERKHSEVTSNEACCEWVALFASKFHDAFEKEINDHKWYESEKVGYDIGFEKAFFDWVEKFEASFVDEWHKENYK